MTRVTRAAAGLEIGAAILLGVVLVAGYSGPLRFDMLGLTVTVRTMARPLLGAVAVVALRLWLPDARPLVAASVGAVTRVVMGALIAAGVIGWGSFLSSTCGGADSYGYVSTADRLLSGHLVQEEPLAASLPFPNGIAAACPLGYVPAGRTSNACVPAYPLGLPALMAVARISFGAKGPFAVAPVIGLALLWSAYLTARAWYSDRETALLACGLLTLNPLVFTYSIQPMSDVPAAAAFTAAVAALSLPRSWPIAAGIAAAITLVIRPALAPAIVALGGVPIVRVGWGGWRHAARYLTPIGFAIVLQGWTHWYLYGDVFSTGYGGIAGLFSLQTVTVNLRSYAYWGFLALGPVWLGAVAIGFSLANRLPRTVLGFVILGVGLPYLFYRPYDHWETLRFLLPAIVIATIVAAAGLVSVGRRLAGPTTGAAVATVVGLLLASTWVSWLSTKQVFTMPEHEARHRLAGELVAQVTPPETVVLALQHSGSIRYYAHRPTINWEHIPADRLGETVRALQARGSSVYLMLDSVEERAIFEARHGRVIDSGAWLPSGQRRNVQLFEARKQVR